MSQKQSPPADKKETTKQPQPARTVGDLIPAPYNPRKISDEQLALLKKALIEFGDLGGIVVNIRTGNICGGHQRVKTLDPSWEISKETHTDKTGTVAHGWITTPEGRLSYREVDWPIKKEKMANIAANKHGGEWDFVKLKDLWVDLDLGDVDMELTGFQDNEMSDLMSNAGLSMDGLKGEDEGESQPVEIPPNLQGPMDKAWLKYANELMEIIGLTEKKGYISHNMTKAVAEIHFIRALAGGRFPRYAGFGYVPMRFRVASGDKKKSMYDLLEGTAKGKYEPKYIRFISQDNPSLDKMLRGNQPVCGHRLPGDFPVDIAQGLINEFCPNGGAVLDPCHGWGGRMVGFLLSDAGEYTGFDPSPETAKGVREMSEDFGKHVKNKKINLFEKCFEDAKLKQSSFHFALTSPPYFDLEKYTGKDNAVVRYKTFDNWDAGFYRPLIAQVYRALKNGGTFALQVGSQSYPMAERGMKHAEDCGFSIKEKRANMVATTFHGTEEEESETIFIFQKV